MSRNDPEVRSLVDSLVKKKLNKKKGKYKQKLRKLQERTKKESLEQSKQRKGNGDNNMAPNSGVNIFHMGNLTDNVTPSKAMRGKGKNSEVVKSPSDTTLYRPALQRGGGGNDILNKISNFVESI